MLKSFKMSSEPGVASRSRTAGVTRPATWAPTQGAGGAAALAAFGLSEREMADLVASGAINLTGS